MTESKIELTERLRREGRWAQASRFKDETLRDLKAKGMKRSEATDAAWEAMATAFPPLAPPDEAAPPSDGTGPDDELIDVGALVGKQQPHDFPRDVTWVYEHLIDRNVRAQDAPTAGAWSLLMWARRNQNRFFEVVMPKVKADAAADPEEAIRKQAKMQVAEINRIIEQMEQGD